jgi:hypothetical protein
MSERTLAQLLRQLGGPDRGPAQGLDRLVGELRKRYERDRAARPQGGARPGYEGARRVFYDRLKRLSAQAELGERVADELLPPLAETRGADDETVAMLRALQRTILRHPAAAQAAVRALVAEGRRYAETEEGQIWRRRLEGSELLHHLRIVWQIASLGSMEARENEPMPSAYVDGLFMAASSGDPDAILDRLFGGPGGEPDAD